MRLSRVRCEAARLIMQLMSSSPTAVSSSQQIWVHYSTAVSHVAWSDQAYIGRAWFMRRTWVHTRAQNYRSGVSSESWIKETCPAAGSTKTLNKGCTPSSPT